MFTVPRDVWRSQVAHLNGVQGFRRFESPSRLSGRGRARWRHSRRVFFRPPSPFPPPPVLPSLSGRALLDALRPRPRCRGARLVDICCPCPAPPGGRDVPRTFVHRDRRGPDASRPRTPSPPSPSVSPRVPSSPPTTPPSQALWEEGVVTRSQVYSLGSIPPPGTPWGRRLTGTRGTSVRGTGLTPHVRPVGG